MQLSVGCVTVAGLMKMRGRLFFAVVLGLAVIGLCCFSVPVLGCYGPQAAGFVGCISNHPFIFRMNNTEYMRIHTNGYVGIGPVYSPGYALDVAGSVHASSHPTSSDSRFKKEVKEVSGVLNKLKNIRAVSFKWNKKHNDMNIMRR